MLSDHQIQFYKELNTLIYLNYSDSRFNITKLSSLMGITRRQLYREMERVGLIPAEFLKEYRLQKAMEIIEKGQAKRVKDLAYKVGFNSSDLFTKHFNLKFGNCPSYFIVKAA